MNNPGPNRHAPEEVDQYLAALPVDQRAALSELHEWICELASECTERVSYGIPIFRLKVDLVGLSAAKNHCELHTMSPSLVESMTEGLEGIKRSGATLQFTAESPFPKELVERIVNRRIEEIGS